MNKSELIQAIVKENGGTKTAAAAFVDTFVGAVVKAVAKGDSVVLAGFGTFSAQKRNARTARNPRTGEAIKVAAKKLPKFKPASTFRNALAPAAKGAKKSK